MLILDFIGNFFVKVFVLLLFVPTFLQEELLIVDLKKKIRGYWGNGCRQ